MSKSKKEPNISVEEILPNCLAIILGGGAGSRLYPLTHERSKPAVPLGGKYRLVDIPISNCINSGIKQAYVLTQYNSHSLNRHINTAYKFDGFSNGFVEILAAEQTPDDKNWYQGTADAVRQNLSHILRQRYRYYLILSGDQLYRMDFRKVLRQHLETNADITLATLPVDREDAKAFGIMETAEDGAITNFVEKPQEDEVLDKLKMPPSVLEKFAVETGGEDRFQASMGIYVFGHDALASALDNDLVDFGKHVIPTSIQEGMNVQSYVFQDYWEDIGTIRSFYEANLDLCSIEPKYNFFDALAPIYTNARFMPASKINSATVNKAIISDGCILTGATIDNCVIGLRSVVERGSTVRDCVIMGADFFNDELPPSEDQKIPMGIGRDCHIEGALIDKNARIGDRVKIHPRERGTEDDGDNYHVRDGIVVIPKGAVIPDDTII